MYSREQVYTASLDYFNGDELAATVFTDKYCLKKEGVYYELTPTDMHRRLAKEFARIETKYPNPMSEEEIFELLDRFKWIIPQGSPMAAIGNKYAMSSSSNCFVIGDHVDSYGGIMRADEEQAQLMKMRGGVGQDISWIRPSGAIASATPLGPNAGTTLYMDRYSNTTREVQQDGRRGALMLSIGIDHPDAEKFIDKKMTQGSVTGANVSVRVSDMFMEALKEEKPFYQTFPVKYTIETVANNVDLESLEEDKLYEGLKVDGHRTYYKKVSPRKLWDKIIHNAWKSAEPGVLFWDRITIESPGAGYGIKMREVSTNPCGEIPLPPYDSCRLLVVNLLSFVVDAYTKGASLDDKRLVNAIQKAMRLMDDVVDLEIEKIDAIIAKVKEKPFPETFQRNEIELWEKIRWTAENGRRVGLGITAEGDMMAALGITYGTEEGTKFAETLHNLIATSAYKASVTLAAERGAFPMWDYEKDQESGFIQRMFSEENPFMYEKLRENWKTYGRRNIGCLTIAPTGSVSIMTQTSSGIEPVFALWYFRKKKTVSEDERVDFVDEVGDKWIEFPVFHKPFIQWFATSRNYTTDQDPLADLMEFSKDELEALAMLSPWYKATSLDVDYVEKVRMQGAVQKWVDHSISVTINMPEDVTEEIIAQCYITAHEVGCKGMTVYRNNSRGNVLSQESVKEKAVEESFDYLSAHKRPKHLKCDIFFKSASKNAFIIIVGKLDGKPYEAFAIPEMEATKISRTHKYGEIHKVKRGRYDLVGENGMPLIEDITQYMIETEQNSTRLVSGMLRHRMDPRFISEQIMKFATINSFHKVLGKVIGSYASVEDGRAIPCPECDHGEMQMSEGCMKCTSCGYAHCG